MSNKYLIKPKHPGYIPIESKCDFCGKTFWESKGSYLKKKKHFCSNACYTEYKKTIPKEKHPRWQGGVSNAEACRRYKKKNPKRISHLKARRYARERGAVGSHTLIEWEKIKREFDYKCAKCHQEKALTKDHIIPLSQGGTDFISNIQPLCRNCNSKKWSFNIYNNPELLEKK